MLFIPSPTRRLVLAILAISPVAAHAACLSRRVLFVCPAGTVKSAIAREVMRKRAHERGITVAVASRGLHPEDHVSPELAARLKADGLEPGREPARPLTDADVREADVVIAFDEAAAAPGLRTARTWAVPSWNTNYDAAKMALAPQVEALLDELAGPGCGPAR